MRFYPQSHEFYCGIDLHAKQMYLCRVDQQESLSEQAAMPARAAAIAGYNSYSCSVRRTLLVLDT